MTHIPFTLLAYLLNATAVIIDKFLLVKNIPNPLTYIFYISLVSLLALPLTPFTKVPSVQVFLLASLSTLLWTSGAYFLYKALQVGLPSRVIPIIGTLIPLLLFVQAQTANTINQQQSVAVLILVLGIVFLTFPDWRGSKMSSNELIFEIVSAVLFALSYLVLKQAYLKEAFLTVLVWSRFILIPLAIFIVLIPKLRMGVLTSNGTRINFLSKAGLLFALGQTAGGFSELLLTFSISLATPALVNSLQGTQYIFLLIFTLILSKYYPTVFKERLTYFSVFSKLFGVFLVGIGLYLLTISV